MPLKTLGSNNSLCLWRLQGINDQLQSMGFDQSQQLLMHRTNFILWFVFSKGNILQCAQNIKPWMLRYVRVPWYI